MDPHYFLYGVALIWTAFAVVQDMRTREVSNWLNFSLIAFVLAYRLFYASVMDDWLFFILGVLGVLLFVGLAYAFYYGRVFAGGDAKLLMGYGGVLPFMSFGDVISMTALFLLVFFTAGVAYTIAYSACLAIRHRKRFVPAFRKSLVKRRGIMIIAFVVAILAELFGLLAGAPFGGAWFALALFLSLTSVYVLALEESIMIRKVNPSIVTEGDWLHKSVKIGKKTITPSVHGLSKSEIALLQHSRKKVWIRYGIPFTPTFLLTLVVMIMYWDSLLSYLPF